MNNKYNKRVYAGYYKRYDGKLIYVITIAKDELSGEDTVIYTPYWLSSRFFRHIAKNTLQKNLQK